MDRGIGVDVVFDQSRYTEARLQSLSANLLAGAGVVVLVVLLAMGLRAALIVGAALPLSVGAALFGLALFGQQIHQMTIFGLIIAIGLLIDNAIVVTDEVRRRMAAGVAAGQAVSAAVRHLFAPLLASTLTTVLAFMPIFLLPGNVGDFVGPIAVSVVLALIASFVISMSAIAALAGRYAAPAAGGGRRWWRDGVRVARLGQLYQKGLGLAVRRPVAAIALASLLPLGGFAAARTLDSEFFPPSDRAQFELELWLAGDASIERTAERARRIEARIRAHPGVERVDWLVGGSFPSVYYNLVMDQDDRPAYGHAIIRAADPARARTLIPALQRELDTAFPQARIVLQPFAQGPPRDAPLAYRIVGPELHRLKAYGEALRRVMHGVPGVLHTQASVTGGAPKLWFAADEDAGRLAGLTLADVSRQFQTSLEGQLGGSVLEGLEELPVRIRYGQGARASLARIRSLNLTSPETDGAGWIAARALGDVELRPEPSRISRRNGERVNKVLGYVAEGALPIEVNEQVLRRLDQAGFRLAPGYRLEVAGEREEQSRAVGLLATYAPVLCVLMVATLVLAFRSLVLAGFVGAVAVLAVGLGMLALWASGFPLGFNPIIGSTGLVGVAINGSIVVLAAIRANPAARAGDAAAIVEQSVGSTRHILATTFTTMGGFAPLLLFTGGDFWPPLAVVIAGGVGLAVTLSLVLTPALYSLVYGHSRRAALA